MSNPIDVTVFSDGPPGSVQRQHYEPRPWARFLAKWFDVVIAQILSLFVFIIIGVVIAFQTESGQTPFMDLAAFEGVSGMVIGVAALVIILWVFEALLISTFAGTPGKALMGISVRDAAGGKLPVGASLARTFKSLALGLGLFIPIVGLITHMMQYNAYKNEGYAAWDDNAEIEYASRPVGHWRWAIAILVYAVYRAAEIAATIAERSGALE